MRIVCYACEKVKGLVPKQVHVESAEMGVWQR